jgi:hypothetical protein
MVVQQPVEEMTEPTEVRAQHRRATRHTDVKCQNFPCKLHMTNIQAPHPGALHRWRSVQSEGCQQTEGIPTASHRCPHRTNIKNHQMGPWTQVNRFKPNHGTKGWPPGHWQRDFTSTRSTPCMFNTPHVLGLRSGGTQPTKTTWTCRLQLHPDCMSVGSSSTARRETPDERATST